MLSNMKTWPYYGRWPLASVEDVEESLATTSYACSLSDNDNRVRSHWLAQPTHSVRCCSHRPDSGIIRDTYG